MARLLSDQEHEELAESLRRHNAQVLDGTLPLESPPDFVRPEGEEALADGVPWWFGPPDPDVETLVVGGDDSIG
jgi:hypothetical protein